MDIGIENIRISDSEWEVLRVIWAQGQVTAQEIVHILGKAMNWKEATIKTLLGRLVKKKAIWVEREGRRFIYHPAVSEQKIVQETLTQLLEHLCNKEVGTMIAGLIEQSTLSQNDIDNISAILSQKHPVDTVVCRCIPGQCQCSSRERVK